MEFSLFLICIAWPALWAVAAWWLRGRVEASKRGGL